MLIAFRLSPLQSAPLVPKRTVVSASGWAVQSSVSDSFGALLPNLLRRFQAACRSSRRRRPWFYLRLTPRGAAISLIRVMRESLWLGECLGRLSAGLKLRTETSLDPASRICWPAPNESPSLLAVTASERYVACTFSFVASHTSPVFHRRSVIATIFRARVSFAISSRTPRATHAS